jgi:hypothetical protein
MDVAMIAARVCGRGVSGNPILPPADRDEIVGCLRDRPDPISRSVVRYEHWLAGRKQRWMQRLVDMEEAERAYDDAIEIQFRLFSGFAAGLGIGRRDPQLTQAMRRFRLAQRRAMRACIGR